MPRLVIDGLIFEIRPTGGIARMFQEMLPTLCGLDPSLRVTILHARRISRAPVHTNIQIRRFKEYGGIRRRLPSRVRGTQRPRFTPDAGRYRGIWHSTYYTVPLKKSDPAVVTVHDLIYEKFPILFRSVSDAEFQNQKEIGIRTADRVVCVSETTKTDLMSYYAVDPSKVRVIPHGVSDEFSQRSPQEPHGASRPYVLYVGPRPEYKNFWRLVRAYQQWPARDEVDLLVVGDPWTDAENRRLQETGVRGRIQLVHGIDDQRLRDLYNRAVALVSPSLYEGFGLPLLEAMACGCPVVASDISASKEIAHDAATYFDPTSVESLCAALDTVIAEPRISERTRRGLELARRYSWENAARAYLDVYNELGRRSPS